MSKKVPEYEESLVTRSHSEFVKMESTALGWPTNTLLPDPAFTKPDRQCKKKKEKITMINHKHDNLERNERNV